MTGPLDYIEAAVTRARALTEGDTHFFVMIGIGAIAIIGERGPVRRERLIAFDEIRAAASDPLTPAVDEIRREVMMAKPAD